MKKVVIDGFCIGRRKTGNERHIRGLIKGLETLPLDNLEIEIFLSQEARETVSKRFNCRKYPLGNFVSRNFVTLPRNLAKQGADIFHATYWTRFWDTAPYKKLVMIHDISFVCFPLGFKRHERLVYANLIKRSAQKAEHILTISEHSKTDIAEQWGISTDRISVACCGVDSEFTPKGASDQPMPEGAPYILYVGNLHPRKNLVRLLDAYVLLRREGFEHQLKIVGQKAWMYGDIFETVRRHRLESSVEFTGYVSNSQLVKLYQNAEVSAYPSLYEGFGLPVLEAMACGCPTVTSRTTSLPEVAGDACILVDPESVVSIADGLKRVLSDADLRRDMTQKGLRQAQKFTWEKTARKTLSVYQKLLNG
jgi:glycosyltransferase involved in cell wall biosynthesis